MNHRIGRILFATIVGLLVAWWAYEWITDPSGRAERRLQERVVMQARAELGAILASTELEVVDPLAPNRKVGKVYVYRSGDGWEVSGYYRHGDQGDWHPFLVRLRANGELLSLKTTNNRLTERAADDERLIISR